MHRMWPIRHASSTSPNGDIHMESCLGLDKNRNLIVIERKRESSGDAGLLLLSLISDRLPARLARHDHRSPFIITGADTHVSPPASCS